jgi:hypothetical protein
MIPERSSFGTLRRCPDGNPSQCISRPDTVTDRRITPRDAPFIADINRTYVAIARIAVKNGSWRAREGGHV